MSPTNAHTPAVRVLEYLESPPFVALHGEQPAKDLCTLLAQRNELREALEQFLATYQAHRKSNGYDFADDHAMTQARVALNQTLP